MGKWRTGVIGVTVLGLAVGAGIGVGVAVAPGDDSTPVLDTRLVAYDSCTELLGALRERGKQAVGPYGWGDTGIRYATGDIPRPAAAEDSAGANGSATASAPVLPHSSTTTQVAGVDEPDVVKTDGRYIVSLDGQSLRIVDVRSNRLRSTLALPQAGGELLLLGDRVVMLSGGSTDTGSGPDRFVERGRSYVGGAAHTDVTVVDIADADAPEVVRSWTFDSREIAARVVDGRIRLILSRPAPEVRFEQDALERNRMLVDALPLDAWLPHWSVTGGDDSASDARTVERLSECGAVVVDSAPGSRTGSRLGTVSVVTLDPDAAAPGAGTSVLGAGDTAYAEGQSLYVAAPQNGGVAPGGVPSGDVLPLPAPVIRSPEAKLDLLAFDISGRTARFLASGTVDGSLHDAYGLSEHRGALRVTTTDISGGGTSVTVLQRRGTRLVTVGRVSGLGPAETVQAVRYLGDRAYVVTFRQIDPLHVLDLSDPTRPVLRGELEVPGFSTLLLPLPGDRLLGVGREVASATAQDGVALAVFDVSDASRPRLLDRKVVPGTWSSATSDPHAVTFDAARGLLLMPSTSGVIGAQLDSVQRANSLALTVAAFTKPYSVQASRVVIAGDSAYELSDRGVAVRELPGLDQTGWIAY